MKDNVTDNLTSQTMTEKNLGHNELRHLQKKKNSINQNTIIVPNIVLILVRKENPS